MNYNDYTPLLLHEAVLSLYRTTEAGDRLGDPLWFGALANQLRATREISRTLVMASGDARATSHRIAEQWSITIERTWLVRRGLLDFAPDPRSKYLLEIVWKQDGLWHRRTFYDVRFGGEEWQSNRALDFLSVQHWRASRCTQSGGLGAVPEIPVVPSYASGPQPVGFFLEAPLLPDTYLLGHYRWDRRMRPLSATLLAWPGTEDTVLTLEINGVLTPITFTLPAGTPNTETLVTLDDFGGITLEIEDEVRWRVTSGTADAEAAAWNGAVALWLQPVTDLASIGQTLGFYSESGMLTGEYLLGQYEWKHDAMRPVWAKAVAWAGQDTDTVLQLEIGGSLVSGATLTLPAGTANTEVASSVRTNFGSASIPARQPVRWKVVSAPGSVETCAWHGAVQMGVEQA